jgi:host factor-I protein
MQGLRGVTDVMAPDADVSEGQLLAQTPIGFEPSALLRRRRRHDRGHAYDAGADAAAADADRSWRGSVSDAVKNLQDAFLSYLRANRVPVTIFLISGIKLQGMIESFERFSILLTRGGHGQLVYKSTISTIAPITPIRQLDGERVQPAQGSA